LRVDLRSWLTMALFAGRQGLLPTRALEADQEATLMRVSCLRDNLLMPRTVAEVVQSALGVRTAAGLAFQLLWASLLGRKKPIRPWGFSHSDTLVRMAQMLHCQAVDLLSTCNAWLCVSGFYVLMYSTASGWVWAVQTQIPASDLAC
jgi:hypothetical protein